MWNSNIPNGRLVTHDQRPIHSIRSIVAASLCGLILTACATLRVGSDFDHTERFSGFHTFSWMPRTNYGSHNPLTVQRARDAIQAALTRKGSTFVSNSTAADFIVDSTIGSHEWIDVNSYPAPYTGPYWGYRGWWGYRYWGPQVDVRQYREGTLSIDLFDTHSHRPVWHGWAKKELTKADMERSEASIQEAARARMPIRIATPAAA